MRATLRSVLPFALVALVAFALGWVVKDRREKSSEVKASAAPPAAVETVTVDYPDPTAPDGRSRRTLRVLQVKHAGQSPGESVQAVPSDPAKTWVLTEGNYGEPGWVSRVAVESP